MEPKINPYYAKLVPRMPQKEYEQLKQSIKDEELHYSIWVNEKGEILDGHHRFYAHQDLGIPFPADKIKTKHFDDPLDEKRWVITINLKRRHLTPFERVEIAYELEKIEAEKARIRQLSKLKNVCASLSSNELIDDNKEEYKGQARDIAAREAGLPPTTYFRGKKIIESDVPEETKRKLRENRVKINAVHKDLETKKTRQNLVEDAARSPYLPEGIKLINGDFRQECKDFQDNSIPLIFTDPPYEGEYLPLYKDLAEVAARVLKPGASLVVYPGHFFFYEVRDMIKEAGLTYWWTLAIKYPPGHEMIYAKNVFHEWKPLQWFVKGDKLREGLPWMPDSIATEHPSKDLHKWGQSPIEAEHVIKRLTVENEIVLDPFLGSGVTGIASLNLKRKFIGIEIDRNTFEVARANITKFLNEGPTR